MARIAPSEKRPPLVAQCARKKLFPGVANSTTDTALSWHSALSVVGELEPSSHPPPSSPTARSALVWFAEEVSAPIAKSTLISPEKAGGSRALAPRTRHSRATRAGDIHRPGRVVPPNPRCMSAVAPQRTSTMDTNQISTHARRVRATLPKSKQDMHAPWYTTFDVYTCSSRNVQPIPGWQFASQVLFLCTVGSYDT